MIKRKFSITWYITATLAISMLLSLLLSFFVVRSKLDTLFLEEVSKNNDSIVSSAVKQLDSTMNEQINTIIGIEVAHHNILGSSNEVLNSEYYESILSQNEYITSLEIVTLDGEIIYSSRTNENRVGVSVETDDLFKQITGIHQSQIGDLVYDSAIENLALQVAYSGEDIIVYSRISIDYFHDYGDSLKESFQNKEIMILDENGLYLYDSANDNHLTRQRYSDFEDLLSSEIDSSYYFEINGINTTVSYEQFFDNDWYLVIYEDVESSLALNRLNLAYYTITILVIVIVLSTVYFGYNIIIINSINDIISKFKQGKERVFTLVEESSRFKEIDEIRVNYNDMITEIDYYIDRLQNLAYYDSLTGIPSKQKAREDFLNIKNVLTEKSYFAYIDIIRFRVINDNYGYEVGDRSLVLIANALKEELGDLYRVEGDEFLGFIHLHSETDIELLIEKLENKITSEFTLIGKPVSIKLKVGLSVFGKDGKTFEELFKKSIIACEAVRENVTKIYTFYDDAKSVQYKRQSKIELDILDALENQDFTTVYQPIIDMKTSKIRGFEALSRWSHKQLGSVFPDEFIPILESRKEIYRLDEYVLNNSLRLSKFIEDEYNVSLISSVNISVETIMRDNFTDLIEYYLNKFDYDPHKLELEITESTIIVDFEKISAKMKYLRRLGVKFSEDDFGDAYSSLTYLSRLQIDTLKISKNFLSTMLSNVESRVLVQTILDLSKKLGFFTIVEGVEDQEVFDLFKKYGCNYVQGYLFYKPMGEKALLDLMKKNTEEDTNEK